MPQTIRDNRRPYRQRPKGKSVTKESAGRWGLPRDNKRPRSINVAREHATRDHPELVPCPDQDRSIYTKPGPRGKAPGLARLPQPRPLRHQLQGTGRGRGRNTGLPQRREGPGDVLVRAALRRFQQAAGAPAREASSRARERRSSAIVISPPFGPPNAGFDISSHVPCPGRWLTRHEERAVPPPIHWAKAPGNATADHPPDTVTAHKDRQHNMPNQRVAARDRKRNPLARPSTATARLAQPRKLLPPALPRVASSILQPKHRRLLRVAATAPDTSRHHWTVWIMWMTPRNRPTRLRARLHPVGRVFATNSGQQERPPIPQHDFASRLRPAARDHGPPRIRTTTSAEKAPATLTYLASPGSAGPSAASTKYALSNSPTIS